MPSAGPALVSIYRFQIACRAPRKPQALGRGVILPGPQAVNTSKGASDGDFSSKSGLFAAEGGIRGGVPYSSLKLASRFSVKAAMPSF